MDEAYAYNEAKEEMQAFITQISVKHTRFQNLVKTSDTTQKKFKESRRELVKEVRQAEKDLKSLRETGVEYVEKNRGRFLHIKNEELKERKKMVSELEATLDNIKRGIDSEEVRRKMEADANKTNFEAQDESSAALQASRNSENARFINAQKLEVKENIKQEDIALTRLGQAVDRLNDMGKTINEELHEQDDMLDDLGKSIEKEEEKMNVVLAQIQKLLNTKDNCQIGLVIALFVVLAVIVVLIIWLP